MHTPVWQTHPSAAWTGLQRTCWWSQRVRGTSQKTPHGRQSCNVLDRWCVVDAIWSPCEKIDQSQADVLSQWVLPDRDGPVMCISLETLGSQPWAAHQTCVFVAWEWCFCSRRGGTHRSSPRPTRPCTWALVWAVPPCTYRASSLDLHLTMKESGGRWMCCYSGSPSLASSRATLRFGLQKTQPSP